MLSGVVGRAAGSIGGYNFSPALKSAHLIWSADKLNEWLAGPQKLVPGARMPVRVLDAPSRHDIIAYLQKISGTNDQANANANARASGPEY